jgi:hypothetical protein
MENMIEGIECIGEFDSHTEGLIITLTDQTVYVYQNEFFLTCWEEAIAELKMVFRFEDGELLSLDTLSY